METEAGGGKDVNWCELDAFESTLESFLRGEELVLVDGVFSGGNIDGFEGYGVVGQGEQPSFFGDERVNSLEKYLLGERYWEEKDELELDMSSVEHIASPSVARTLEEYVPTVSASSRQGGSDVLNSEGSQLESERKPIVEIRRRPGRKAFLSHGRSKSGDISFATPADFVIDKRGRNFDLEDNAEDLEVDRYRKDRRKFVPTEQQPENFEASTKSINGGQVNPQSSQISQTQSLDNLVDELKGIVVQENKEKPCKCTSCGKSFARKYTLIQHMRIHSNERAHRCPVEGCEKQFVQKANLSQHMRYHTGEKPYECDEPYCNATYHQLANLKSHLKAKHGRDVPRKCRIRGCGKGFVTAKELSEHLRIEHNRNTNQTQPPSTKSSSSSLIAS